MAESFRFSPRRNRADEVAWRSWGKEAFEEAASRDLPILLCLTASWCRWCQHMDETTYSDEGVIDIINRNFIPIRADADREPHVADRYVTAGWPTNAFLTPTGEVLWSGTYAGPEQLASMAESVHTAWAARRAELGAEIERRRKALETSRARSTAFGLVRREPADDVFAAIIDSFDARNGGFGTSPKFPNGDAIELLLAQDNDAGARRIAAQTIDGMLAGELWDHIEGGFHRYALNPDWTKPQLEKLLAVNAMQLRTYATASAILDRADWGETAVRIVDWVNGTLLQRHGLWAGSQAADAEYFTSDVDARRGTPVPFIDETVYTSANAAWIRALADAGSRLGVQAWVQEAAARLQQLLDTMAAPDGLLYHFQVLGSEPQLPILLTDILEAARACISVAQADGDTEWLMRARSFATVIERRFWAPEGGFYDRVRSDQDVGVLRYRDRPFEANAEAARLLLDLAHATGERSYRALAERALAVIAPQAGRFGINGAAFALAVHAYFEPPTRIFVVGDGEAADALFAAAHRLPVADRRIWKLPQGGRIGTLQLAMKDKPCAYVSGRKGAAAPVFEPGALADALANAS